MSYECGCGGITPLVYRDQVPDEVFVVTTNRRDGTQPKVSKVLGQQWFDTEAGAQSFAGGMNAQAGSDHYGVYRAHVIILDRT